MIQLKVEELNALHPAKIAEDERVKSRFVQLFDNIHGKKDGFHVWQKEAFNFSKLLAETPTLQKCSKLSLYGCFLDMAVNGLSLDPTGKPHCYLIPRKAKVKLSDGKEGWEDRASLSVTGYGELVMRMRAGQIKYVDNPVIVYEEDVFNVSLINGKKNITYSAASPRKTTNVKAAFIRIVRNDGSEDYQWLMEGDIERLKKYSEKANSYYDKEQKKKIIGDANALYVSNKGQIDPGFLENKMIKHAFDAYPKVRIGSFTQLETMEEEPPVVDYGIVTEAQQTPEPLPLNTQQNKPSFIPPATPPPTITVPTSEEDKYAGF
jgi:recombinational DNA repair protein RecT